MSLGNAGIGQTGHALGQYLSYLTARQEAIASNIANADTPGFKTRDVEVPVDFSGAIEEARDMVVDVPGLTTRNDGNNVSIDREARLLAENTLKFTLATQLLRGEIKDIRSAIEEGRAA
ncbi:MAG TPA: flagellar basal body protein [Bryobacteraceae bacterium]|nr:flagellar basal body protein [Bryobacteraceae bacterium]